MSIASTRRASEKGTQTRPTQFKSKVVALENVQVLALQYDQAKTLINEDTLYPLTTPNATGVTFGFNSQMYVGHLAAYNVHFGNVKMYGIPIAEPTVGAAPSAGTVTFGGAPTESGFVIFYVNGKRKSFTVAATDDVTAIALAYSTVLNAATDTLLTGAPAAGVVTTTATFSGTTGDNIRVLGAYKSTDVELPDGLTMAIVQPIAGGGDEEGSLTTAYAAFAADPEWKTELVPPTNGTATLDLALSTIGLPDDGTGAGTGLWKDSDYRPATAWVATIETTQATAEAITENRDSDANNVVIAAPDRPEMPFEIAAAASAFVAKSANLNAATKYQDKQIAVINGPVLIANDWTGGANGSNNRDSALKAGLTTIFLDSNSVSTFGDVATPYKPAAFSFPPFQFEVNKRKTWNIGKSLKDDKISFQNDVIVESVAAATDQVLATDVDTEKGRIASLAVGWQKFGWSYNAAFTIENMVVTEGGGGNPDRFDRAIPVILSANKRVESDVALIDRDTSIASSADVIVKIG